MDKSNETITIELPTKIKVTGARGITRELDMTKATPQKVAAALDYWFGVLTQRASASVDGFDEKKNAEKKKADEIVSWQWEPGRHGGGARIDETEAATRRLLETLFTGAGMKKTDARKAAKAETRWEDYFRLVMKQQLGNVTDGQVAAEVVAQQTVIDNMIQAEIEAERERQAAKKALAGKINLTI